MTAGVPAMARELARMGYLSKASARSLGYALGVANKGFHGHDVRREEAMEALAIADRVVQDLRRARPTS
jgi:hypothetical protein